MADLAVLAAGEDAELLADALGADLVDSPTGAGGRPLVVLASEASDVVNLARAIERRIPVDAIVAWRLAEDHLGRLLDLPVPVFIGLPSREDLNAALRGGGSGPPRSAERAQASQFSLMERLLGSHGHAPPG